MAKVLSVRLTDQEQAWLDQQTLAPSAVVHALLGRAMQPVAGGGFRLIEPLDEVPVVARASGPSSAEAHRARARAAQAQRDEWLKGINKGKDR